MRKLKALILSSFMALALLITPVIALAATDPLADACGSGAQSSSVCKDKSGTGNGNPIFGPNGVLTNVTQIVTIAVGVVSVIMIMIGGFKYILSAGDPKNVESAKNTILYAVIGLAIALMAYAIVIFVLGRL